MADNGLDIGSLISRAVQRKEQRLLQMLNTAISMERLKRERQEQERQARERLLLGQELGVNVEVSPQYYGAITGEREKKRKEELEVGDITATLPALESEAKSYKVTFPAEYTNWTPRQKYNYLTQATEMPRKLYLTEQQQRQQYQWSRAGQTPTEADLEKAKIEQEDRAIKALENQISNIDRRLANPTIFGLAVQDKKGNVKINEQYERELIERDRLSNRLGALLLSRAEVSPQATFQKPKFQGLSSVFGGATPFTSQPTQISAEPKTYKVGDLYEGKRIIQILPNYKGQGITVYKLSDGSFAY